MPLRPSLPSLLVVGGIAWYTLGLPLRPSETTAYSLRFGTPRVVGIGHLREGEVLSARYRSTSSHHSITGRMSFRRNEDRAIEVRVWAQYGLFADIGAVKRELTDAQMAALDGVLFRSRIRGWRNRCTTHARIDLSHYRHGRYVGHERVDLHCPTMPWPPPFSFDNLVDEALIASPW